MRKIIIAILLSLPMLVSCNRHNDIVSLAKENLPPYLDMEMRDYMGTVEAPVIKDLTVVYACDSLCVLQCHASAKDEYGDIQSESVRYIFIKDVFVSALDGRPAYCQMVRGAVYLDKKGIADFCDKMKNDSQKLYVTYLSQSKPVNLFE